MHEGCAAGVFRGDWIAGGAEGGSERSFGSSDVPQTRPDVPFWNWSDRCVTLITSLRRNLRYALRFRQVEPMHKKPIEMKTVLPVAGYGLVVRFSDGTLAKYTVEELLELRPYREDIEESRSPGGVLTCLER